MNNLLLYLQIEFARKKQLRGLIVESHQHILTNDIINARKKLSWLTRKTFINMVYTIVILYLVISIFSYKMQFGWLNTWFGVWLELGHEDVLTRAHEDVLT